MPSITETGAMVNSTESLPMQMGVVNPAYSDAHDDTRPEQEHTQEREHIQQRELSKEQEEDPRCGWCALRPDWLQPCRSAKWALFWLCWAGGLQGLVVNGLVNVVITTLERRFGLRSSHSGLVAGGYDVASFFCLAPVAYLGGRAASSKPRWLGSGVLLMGIGSLVFALPQLLAGPYRGAGGVEATRDTCPALRPSGGDVTQDENCPSAEAGTGSGLMVFLLFVGQLLHGAGAAPLYTLGVTFIDENVSKKMSSVYLGIFYTMAVVGPALGYVLGGQLLQVYTDFITVDPAQLGLTPLSAVWVGAWWLGFLGAAVGCLLLAVPLLALPAQLPGAAALRAEKESEAHGASAPHSTQAFGKLREMPRAFRALITNPAFFFLNLAGASEGMLLAGFAAFLPKLMENQFSVSASRAALLMGLVTVPAGGGGTFLGGYLVKRLGLRCGAIMKMCAAACALCALCTLCFLFSCPNAPLAGVSRSYGDGESTSPLSLNSACNEGCQCRGLPYDPVCGADGILYFSPCHAGCTAETIVDSAKMYSNCSCVSAHRAPPPRAVEGEDTRRRRHVLGQDPEEDSAFSIGEDEATVEYDAINEPCPSECPLLWAFIGLAGVTMLLTFLVTMPALTATLRCVEDDQRSFALGIQWIIVRLLGTIPAPVLFGLLMDESCVLWECGGGGACLAYDNPSMSRRMAGIALLGKLCSLAFFSLAWRLYRPPHTGSGVLTPVNGST